jgi:formylglycine-generating enzyme required for sulfatase activity
VPYWNDARNHGGGTPNSDEYPVLGVNWDSATAYCNWLSAKTGKKYRLPTERNGRRRRGHDQRRYPWGNEIDRSLANFVGAQAFDTGRPPGFYDGTKRGELQTRSNASPYGAFDMAGNVMEWCSDWYGRDYYSVSPKKNPKGPSEGAYRVVRGGTFFMEEFELRSYARSGSWPSFQGHRMTGFRWRGISSDPRPRSGRQDTPEDRNRNLAIRFSLWLQSLNVVCSRNRACRLVRSRS